jgi:SAM-dependent methyltransferase
MDNRINRVASLANIASYDAEATARYVDGAPHIKHASLRTLYGRLVVDVFDDAKKHAEVPTVLDLGAGEGSVTLPFLELGARVTAVDISPSQLEALRGRCERFGEMLEVRCEDINDTLEDRSAKYDIVVTNSFLHHIPDYLGMIEKALGLLSPHGQFFSFQDPLRYDSIGKAATAFNNLAYLTWRIFRGDVIGGLKRRLRRSKGIYLEDAVEDQTEYHAVRGGLDHDAVEKLFRERGYDCVIFPYYSTQSSLFQPLGTMLGIKNTFAVIAREQGP